MDLITPDYLKLNQELHEQDPEWGITSPFVCSTVATLIGRYQCQTVLDYGCGKGKLLGARYDPAIPEYAAPPEPADLVVCSAVLEHVEFMSLYPVLNELERLTQKVAFITVSTVDSTKILSDGSNAHRVVKPIEWWIVGLSQRWKMKAAENFDNWFWFLGKKK